MPRLHFPDQALVRRLVEAAVKSGKPLMLAHDYGVYLCGDAVTEPDGTCICAYAKGCDPRQNDAALEVANHLVGHDDFGISFPMGGQEQLLADLKSGHRLAIDFGKGTVVILTQAPPTKRSQPTPAARGRGAGSPSTARDRSSNMSKKKSSTQKTAPKGAPASPKAIAEARKVVEANLKAIAAADQENSKKRDERAASRDGATASERAMAPQEHEVPSAKERANDANLATARKKGAVAGVKQSKRAKTATQPKAKRAKRTSALDAAATVLKSAKEPMTAGALIDAMATRDLWKSPGGKTPHATLYAAIIREIKAKGRESRFTKTDRGLFVATNGKAA